MSQLQKIDFCQATLLDYLYNLIGVPYKDDGRTLDGLDCYGLLYLVYKSVYKVEVPSLTGVYTGIVDKSDLSVMVESKHTIWSIVDKPQLGDVLLFRVGRKRHVGLWLGNGKMVHSVNNSSVCIEKYDNFYWKEKLIGIYRHNSVGKPFGT